MHFKTRRDTLNQRTRKPEWIQKSMVGHLKRSELISFTLNSSPPNHEESEKFLVNNWLRKLYEAFSPVEIIEVTVLVGAVIGHSLVNMAGNHLIGLFSPKRANAPSLVRWALSDGITLYSLKLKLRVLSMRIWLVGLVFKFCIALMLYSDSRENMLGLSQGAQPKGRTSSREIEKGTFDFPGFFEDRHCFDSENSFVFNNKQRLIFLGSKTMKTRHLKRKPWLSSFWVHLVSPS